MDAYLSHSGFIVPLAGLKKLLGGNYSNFLTKLTIITPQKIGKPKIAQMYKITSFGNTQCMILPRTLIAQMVSTRMIKQLNILFSPARKISATLGLELYPGQRTIVNKLLTVLTAERCSAGTATALLNLRPGMGKTFVAAGLIAALGLRTLYIVPKLPLATQAVTDLRGCFYSEETNTYSAIVGKYGPIKKRDPRTNHVNQDVTVMIINSALEKPPEFFAGYSFIIYDEVHSYCTNKRQEIFRRPTHYGFGMSGTTENRQDKFDPVAHKELAYEIPDGGIIRAEEIPGFSYDDIEFAGRVEAVRYNGPPEYTKSLSSPSTGRLFTPDMNKQFLSDPYRRQLAIKKLRELYDWRGPAGQKHGIYVFCETRDALHDLYLAFQQELNSSSADPAIIAPELTDVGEFIGGISDKQCSHIRQNARVLLTTYGYSGTGVSIDDMTAIIFLTPRRANMLQIVARILRRGGDLSIERVIIDIIDNKTPIKNQFVDRAMAYDKYGFDVAGTKISYTEFDQNKKEH